jgi:hypothetical protein
MGDGRIAAASMHKYLIGEGERGSDEGERGKGK